MRYLAACAGVLSISLFLAAAPENKEHRTPLPRPRLKGPVSVEQALRSRRSVRRYDERALGLDEVSQVLWAAQGITTTDGKRTAPSAGALYPLEIYLIAGKVNDLAPGIYHYLPRRNALQLLRPGDARKQLADVKAAWGQRWVWDAPAVVVISAVPRRTARKYGGRAMRYIYMEVGCVCQNIHLQCEALALGTVAIGAFEEKAVKRTIGEDPIPLLLMPLGAKPVKPGA